jgi:rfaE bifunctional protein nucleotidyltransferase chain/domain
MIVFTNGVFDILHIGHIRLLEFARSFGGQLVVAINSDESVRRLKGDHRPYNNQNVRREMLLALKTVDYVHVFDEPTPIEALKKFKPAVIIKGSDYKIEDVVTFGDAKVVLAPTVPGFSTTNYENLITSRRQL